MKSRMVLWGEEDDKKTLIALELISEENKVNIHTFSEQIATEEFYKEMMDNWREDKEINFPEGFNTISRPLSVTDNLLPENIKVERTDLIARAKTEWHFAVLSSKLYQMYKTELEEFTDRLSKLVNYDQGLWDDLKEFWSKVQNQAQDRNLFRDHVKDLREQTNKIFDDLKEKKSILNEEFKKTSMNIAGQFHAKLDVIEEKINKGLGLKPLFDELRNIQKDFKDQKMTHGDKRKVWDRLDTAFKNIKEKRFGDGSSKQNSNLSRLENRYNGLLNAIQKMEKSINRDKSDIAFQEKRINKTDGQLEMQIRQAKLKMIEERIKSKDEKYQDMLKTKTQLEQKMELERKKEEARKKKNEERKEIAKAKKSIKTKIADDIEKSAQNRAEEDEKLKKAAAAIKENKKDQHQKPKQKEDLISAVSATVGEVVEDAVDTVKAVAEVVGEVVGDKVENIIEEIKEEFAETKSDIVEKIKETTEKVEELVDSKKNNAPVETSEVEESIDETIAQVEAVNEGLEAKVAEVDNASKEPKASSEEE